MTALFDIRDHGARPGAESLQTAALQAAIDACHAAGGGRVYGAPGVYRTGTLYLKSRVDLHLAPGCRLLGSTNPDDYDELAAPGFHGDKAPEKSAKSLILAISVEDAAITGPGEINGSGPAFYDTSPPTGHYRKPATPRPRLVTAWQCRNLRFEDASFVDSPCWTFWLIQCRQVAVHRIKVLGDMRMINHDGLDLDMCRDVTVSDSQFKTGDDCIILRAIRRVCDEPVPCENITVSNCVLESACQGIRIGCPSDGVIRHAVFSNLVITSTNNGILFENPTRYLAPGDTGSADIHDILFSNVVIDCRRHPIRVNVEPGIALNRLAGLTFSNMRVRGGAPCVIQGSPETTIRDIRFTDVRLETDCEDALLCRHCEGVRLDGLEVVNRPQKKV